MRAIKRYISKKWFLIAAGLVLTEIFVRMAYAERGYVAYGGEWLTLPIILIGSEVLSGFIGSLKCLFGTEDDYEPEGDRRYRS